MLPAIEIDPRALQLERRSVPFVIIAQGAELLVIEIETASALRRLRAQAGLTVAGIASRTGLGLLDSCLNLSGRDIAHCGIVARA